MEITNEQKTVTSNVAIGFLKEIVGYDMDDAISITENILDDVVEDIECTADWSNLEHDEVNFSDVELAVKRVIYDRIVHS